MAFLAAMLQKQTFMMKRNECQFKTMMLQDQKQDITAQIRLLESVESENQDKVALAELANLEDALDTELEALDSEMQLINQDIDALQGLVQNNIQQDCAWWAVSG